MKTKTLLLITVLALIGLPGLKAQNLLPKLQELFGAQNVVRADSSAFKEYYKINIPQLIDHTDKNKGLF